jgi:hypothetical protein
MTNLIGAYCQIQWQDNKQKVDGVYFSFEQYNAETEITASGINDEKVFYYADNEKELKSLMKPNDGDFIITEIEELVKGN